MDPDNEEMDNDDYATLVKVEAEDTGQEVDVDTKDWQDGAGFLPPGWLYKTVHGHTADYNKLLAPGGMVFNNKVKALNFMIENSYPEDEVNKMRESFVYDGWSESTLLPESWKFRKCKSDRNEYQFMAPTGEIFNSRRGLLEHFKASPDITDEEVDNAQMLFDEIKATWVSNLQDYVEGDRTVPPGWRIKYFSGVKANREARSRCYILSPSGVRFQSRAKAVQYMVDNQYSSEHISYMLHQLTIEGWRHHPSLPHNWRIKKKEYIKAQGSYLLTSEGLILTVKRAVEHILSNPATYSAEDAAAVESVAKMLTKERTVGKTEWVETESAPLGWSYRAVTLRNVPFKREYFQTEAGLTIKGRVAAIKHLLELGRAAEDSDVLLLRLGLGEAGWSEPPDQMLPPGWLQKPIIGGDEKKCKFLAPDYTEFKTLVDVYQFMKTNCFDREVVKKVEQQLDFKEILRNKTLSKNTSNWMIHKWEDADFLPDQWKFAEKTQRYGNKKYIYLSPSGFMLNKTVEALLLMIEEKVEDKFVASMSDRLELDGWRTHPSLPLGWRFCSERKHFPDNLANKETDLVFITPQYQVLTKCEADKFLKDKAILSETELSNITLLMEGDESSWVDDENLPEGWKLKEISLTNKKIYRVKSPNGTQYNGILEAYSAMIGGGYALSELSNMKIKLREEGFEEHANLPEGWMIIRNRGDNLFELLSRDGVVYQTLDSALAQMDDLNYSHQEKVNLENLCLDLVEEYLSGKMLSVKGKRKGKVKPNFVTTAKKQRGRKKKDAMVEIKVEEDEDYFLY